MLTGPILPISFTGAELDGHEPVTSIFDAFSELRVQLRAATAILNAHHAELSDEAWGALYPIRKCQFIAERLGETDALSKTPENACPIAQREAT